MRNSSKNEHYSECLPLAERKFINYLKKWYLGARNEFIKKEIKRNSELEVDVNNDEAINAQITNTNTDEGTDSWVDGIENRELYWLVKNLPDKRRTVIDNVIIHNLPLSQVAKELGISKQLAHAYKAQFLNHAKQILKSSNG